LRVKSERREIYLAGWKKLRDAARFIRTCRGAIELQSASAAP
jgi:hypothetical protein